jgi:hypothetical protein
LVNRRLICWNATSGEPNTKCAIFLSVFGGAANEVR